MEKTITGISLSLAKEIADASKTFKFFVFSAVLFFKKIFSTPILFKATIIDGTTPPAPIIRAFLLFAINLQCLIANSKPAMSVLCPISLFSILYMVLTEFVCLASSLSSSTYEIKSFLKGEITISKLETTLILKTRQYAKRQRTWFRNKLADWNTICIDHNTDIEKLAYSIEEKF